MQRFCRCPADSAANPEPCPSCGGPCTAGAFEAFTVPSEATSPRLQSGCRNAGNMACTIIQLIQPIVTSIQTREGCNAQPVRVMRDLTTTYTESLNFALRDTALARGSVSQYEFVKATEPHSRWTWLGWDELRPTFIGTISPSIQQPQ